MLIQHPAAHPVAPSPACSLVTSATTWFLLGALSELGCNQLESLIYRVVRDHRLSSRGGESAPVTPGGLSYVGTPASNTQNSRWATPATGPLQATPRYSPLASPRPGREASAFATPASSPGNCTPDSRALADEAREAELLELYSVLKPALASKGLRSTSDMIDQLGGPLRQLEAAGHHNVINPGVHRAILAARYCCSCSCFF